MIANNVDSSDENKSFVEQKEKPQIAIKILKDLLNNDEEVVFRTRQKLMENPKNYLCNFRAPDFEHWQLWEGFKLECQQKGLDICHVVLSLCESWLNASQGIKQNESQITAANQIVNLQQTNLFNYNVGKPRREPEIPNRMTKWLSQKHLRSIFIDCYVLQTLREINESASYLGFPLLNPTSFHRSVKRLIKKGKIMALEPRTCPRVYILPEWKPRYENDSENNRVKHLFTDLGGV